MIICWQRNKEVFNTVQENPERTSLRHVDVLFVPGIGPERAGLLHKLGIYSVYDLLYYFPFRYDELTQPSAQKADGAKVSVIAQVVGPPAVRFRQAKSTVTVPVRSDGSTFKAVFFNQPYVRHQLTLGKIIRIQGRYTSKYGSIQVSSFEFIKDETVAVQNPVYRVTENLSIHALRKMIQTAIRTHLEQMPDILPADLRMRYKLVSVHDAIRFMHTPQDAQELHQARRRLIFEEFLLFQLRVQVRRHVSQGALQHSLDLTLLQQGAKAFSNTLPFALTAAQQQAIAEILRDIASARPMYRLLQGDVGAGKTAVAFAAISAISQLNMQSALMAPTGILAMQHYRDAKKWLAPLGIRVACLLGGARDRAQILEKIRGRDIDVVIGTHALISEDVEFAALRLVVTDEQHRFGVQVRKSLRQKGGQDVDVLHLSATPIPRTLALTLYGDIAISTMRERPAGRLPIETLVLSRAKEAFALQRLRQELAKGRQAYVVAPRIEADSLDDEQKSAVRLHEKLEEELGFWQVGLIHGAMNEVSRTQVMEAFVEGKVHVLVATSIIEVGVSVANATVMLIYDADRFGLATLHQLRGRVGRSTMPSLCLLIADPKTPEARERLLAMAATQDGFVLAQKDLELRGPGEVFGDRQSGLPTFAVGDPIADLRIMEVARDVVGDLMASGDLWLLPAYGPLREYAMQAIESLADS